MNLPAPTLRFPAWLALIVVTLLSAVGCGQAGPGGPAGINRSGADAPQLYRCDEGISFTATVNDESALLDGDWGKATLLRDAGGEGQARVYSNRNLRAEFGLGPDGRATALHELTGLDSSREPMHLSCRRE